MWIISHSTESNQIMQSLDLAAPEAVLKYLEPTPFRSHSATPLTGGFGNYAYRIRLQNEYLGNTSYILKHGKPYVPGMTLEFSLDRQVHDYFSRLAFCSLT